MVQLLYHILSIHLFCNIEEMTILKIQDFNKLLLSNKIAPVYLLAGEESYLVDMYLNKIERFLGVNDLSKEIFSGEESSLEDILNAVQTPAFLGKKKVVIVKDVNKMKVAIAEQFIVYLSNIIKTTCLILLYKDNHKKELIAKRKELIDKCIFSEHCICVDCRRQYENEVREFIKNEFAQKGKKVSCDVITRIIDENGTDLSNISNEIEKLSLFVGKNIKNILQDDLEKISGRTKEINIYALSSNIEGKNLAMAVFILEKLLNEGEEHSRILSTISLTVRKLLSAKSMMKEQGMSIVEIASVLRIHKFYAATFFRILKKHRTSKLKNSLKKILEADIAIKTGSCDPISALEETVLFICG
jgi:DNA polymerase-3 subunit delta